MDLQTLRSVSFLKALSAEEFEAFAALLTVREFQNGERVVEEKAPIHALYIVLSGTLHARRLAQKREMLLARIGPGAFFGEINLFDSGVATASIYAMERVQLAVIDYGRLRDFMAANPSAGYKIVAAMMTELSQRLRATNDRFVKAMYWSSLNAPQ